MQWKDQVLHLPLGSPDDEYWVLGLIQKGQEKNGTTHLIWDDFSKKLIFPKKTFPLFQNSSEFAWMIFFSEVKDRWSNKNSHVIRKKGMPAGHQEDYNEGWKASDLVNIMSIVFLMQSGRFEGRVKMNEFTVFFLSN